MESLTFRDIRLESTELVVLDQLFEACPARSQYLRNIHLSLILPTYSPKRYGEYETDADRAANNSAVTKELEKVFRILRKWCGTEAFLDLDIMNTYSPSDVNHRADLQEASDRPDLEEGRYRYSLLNLVEEGSSGLSLPPLPCVRRFTIGNGPRPWHPEAVVRLTSKMT